MCCLLQCFRINETLRSQRGFKTSHRACTTASLSIINSKGSVSWKCFLREIILALIPFFLSCETPSLPLRARWPKCRAGNWVLGAPQDSGRFHCPSLCLRALKRGVGAGRGGVCVWKT